MNEALLQSYLVRQAKAHGVFARKLVAVGNTGFPDVMLAKGGQVIFIELKSPTGKGKLSRKQILELNRMLDAGLDVRVIKSREEVDAIIRELINY